MGKKYLSLIIVPHGKSNYRTLSVTKKTLKILLSCGIVLAVLIAAVTVDYVRIQVMRKTYRAVLSENQRQKETLVQYQTSIGTLNKKVESLETYQKKLNLIAGIKSQDVLKDVGVGPVKDAAGEGQTVSGAPPQLSAANIKSLSQKTDDVQKNFDTLLNFFENRTNQLASTPTIWPTVGMWTSSFGWRADPFTQEQEFHKGIDIAAGWGSPVVATADGSVIAINNDKMLGISITISHGFGVTTLYAHLNKVLVRIGQKVKRRDIIGEVGNTGKALGPHLHYEVHLNDRAMNPYSYILEEE
jgi:murein DD-endopeptidase MepM/ murein hydrolase activator NlpD